MKAALVNPTTLDILNYPIEEFVCDINGDPVLVDNLPKTTGTTLEWSIKGGQTAVFPKYVADYLVSIYPFLQRRKISAKYLQEGAEVPAEVEELGDENESLERKEGEINCRYCDYVAKTSIGLGMHVAAKHPEKL